MLSCWITCVSALPDRGNGLGELRRLAAGAAIILLACLLQFHLLTRDARFHSDEAFFMTFARGAAVQGDWLLSGSLDKPPLSIYLSALSMIAVGNSADAAGVLQLDVYAGEFAAALPNVMLALLFTALMMRLAWQRYRDWHSACLAGLLSATSPYLASYGAAAFTDMSLLFFALVSLYFAGSRRWALAGLALGLAFWGKQQAVFVAIFLALLLIKERASRRDWLRFALPLGFAFLALLAWDAARPGASIFLQAAANNAPDQLLAPPSSWLGRLAHLLGAALWLPGPPALTLLLLAGAGFAAYRRPDLLRSDRGLMAALCLYLAIHVVFGFRLYDRFLLLLLPLLILPVARGLSALSEIYARRRLWLLILATILLGALGTFNGETPVIRGRAAYAGIDQLADYLNSKPVATVIYDRWLGWQLDYYLGTWHDKRRVYHPTADALVADALKLDETGARYFSSPLALPYEPWIDALHDAGFAHEVDYRSERFIAFRLLPPKN